MRILTRGLTTTHDPERIAIYRHAEMQPILVQQAARNARAFIHPIRVPDGDGTLTENAPEHHPWQHGLYVGMNAVNGIGFWTEGLVPQPHRDGTFHPRPLSVPVVDNDSCQWSVVCDWCAPDVTELLVETQEWTLRDLGTSYEIDLVWTLRASIDLSFSEYPYGGLFVRMPFVQHGSVLTSEGHQSPDAAEGQRARWVAIAMPIPDRHGSDPWAGLAMMDHPGNPQYPVPWRVDGQLGIAPSRCIAGGWKLPVGEASIARHRLYVHPGRTDPSAVESSWSRFTS